MPYVSQSILVERYTEALLLQLTDRATPSAGTIDSDVVDRALADTDAEVDGYLARRYRLPLAETPPLLVDIAARIAIYKLHVYTPEKKIEDDYREAIRSLDRIAEGRILLPVAGIEPSSSGAAGVVTIDRDRDLTPENLRGFI